YYPNIFKEALTIILYKLEKSNYNYPKLYYPITLLNTIDKVIEVVITTYLSYTIEIFLLL
ncbi:hypothetical protein IWZ03DRAFT_300864, partial [Phyllosticta citriasiana]